MTATCRLSIFLGKGGVGRTTLACAFAVDRAAAGERVLLVSLAHGDQLSSRIQHEAAGVDTDALMRASYAGGRHPAHASGRLELLALDARALVDDLVRKITRLGAMA